MRLQTAIVALSVLLCTVEFSAAQNYCNLASCKGKKHIACNNNGAFASICFANAKVEPITTPLKNALVNRHNFYRDKVAKGDFSRFMPAARMAPMRWNAELARLAVFNVKQCAMKHDQCRNTPAFQYAGQNLYAFRFSGKPLTVMDVAMKALKAWFDEYKYCTLAQINKYSNPPNSPRVGHFTQLMQEKATAVGCAILRQSKNGQTQQFMACNYARTNIENKPVYVTSGRAANKCKTGKNPRFRFLCSYNEKYAVNVQ